MKISVGLWIMMIAGSAWADSVEAVKHADRGLRWHAVAQYQKAIEEYEQAYQQDDKPFYLYVIAQEYDRISNISTKSTAEVLAAKQQAFAVYEKFIEKAPSQEPGLDVARSRLEPLRQEMKQLEAQMAEREASLKELRDDMKQLVTEVREVRRLQELILQWMRGERSAVPTAFVH